METDLDEVMREWRGGVFSTLDWERCPSPAGVEKEGGSKGFFVRADGFPFLAFLKPTIDMLEHTPWSAVEKICADIAIDLGLPVAPVQLYRRTDAPQGVEQRTCLSLVMHEDFRELPSSWTPQDALSEIAVKSALARASGVVALDAYLQNSDRSEAETNIIFYHNRDNPDKSGFFFIDFANCLNRQDRWVNGGWESVTVPNLPKIVWDSLDLGILMNTVEDIENLPDSSIEEIVRRIPEDYQSAKRRDVVESALKERRGLIRSTVAEHLG